MTDKRPSDLEMWVWFENFISGMKWDDFLQDLRPKDNSGEYTEKYVGETMTLRDRIAEEMTKENAKSLIRTSEAWNRDSSFGFTVLDPDGWRDKRDPCDWYKDQITREEFERRAIQGGSTLKMTKAFLDNLKEPK
jgi:hypothetical protein